MTDRLCAAIAALPDQAERADEDSLARHRGLLAAQVADLVVETLSRANLLTDEDLRLIREHVRPKDAGDLAELAVQVERIRAARVAHSFGAGMTVVDAILSGKEVT